MRVALIYLAAITIAEVVTVLVQPIWGIAIYIVVLAAVIVHSALASEPRLQQLALSLALVPLVRIISLCMPLANIPLVWQYPITYVPLLIAAVLVIRILGYSREDVGLTFRLSTVQLAVALSGLALGVIEYLILTEEAEAAGLILQETRLLAAFLLLVCTGFGEELIFRGVLQRSAVAAFGNWGIVYVSLLFAIVHLIHHSAIDIAFVFVIALFFGWVVKKTGSLLGVTLSHGITNIILYLVVPFFF